MKKQLFYLLLFLPISTLFAMEERQVQISFPRSTASQEIAIFEAYIAQDDIGRQRFYEIYDGYTSTIKKVIDGKLSLAHINKNDAIVSDDLTRRKAQIEYDRIHRLVFDVTHIPINAYLSLYNPAVAFRNLDPQIKARFDDLSIPAMKQAYRTNNVFKPDYLENLNNFRIALDYESDKIFGEITKKCYAYKTFKDLKEALHASRGEIIDKNIFSKGFHQKIAGFYKQLKSLKAITRKDPLSIIEVLEKIQCMNSSMRHFRTVMNLNDLEEQALNPALALLDRLNTYHEKLLKLLSKTSILPL